MESCKFNQILLDLFVDGELSPEEMHNVQAHLDTCPACRACVDDALAIRAAFPTVEDTPVPDGFTEAVMAAISAQGAKKKPSRAPWKKALLPLAACFALVGLAMPLARPGLTEKAAAPAYDAAPAEMPAAEECAPEAPAPSTYGLTLADEAPRMERQEASKQESTPPFAELSLTAAEAGDLLAGYTPVSDENGVLTYHLTRAEYTALLSALAPDSPSALGDDADGYALVTVTP